MEAEESLSATGQLEDQKSPWCKFLSKILQDETQGGSAFQFESKGKKN